MLVLLMLIVASLLSISSVFCLKHLLQTSEQEGLEFPAVSVLKPLCGLDEELEQNLISFFELDYPHFELLFGVEGEEDPCLPLVYELCAKYPHIASKVIVHDGFRGFNPKVANLQGILECGSEDLVLISDSNIRVSKDYLKKTVQTFQKTPNAGIVTNVIIGSNENNLGSLLDSLQMNGWIASSLVWVQYTAKDTYVVGKSMLFKLSTFEKLGGWNSVKNVLSEDYVMSRMFLLAGFRCVFAPVPIWNVNSNTSFSIFWKRHLRWSASRSKFGWTVCAEPITNIAFLSIASCFYFESLYYLLAGWLVVTLRETANWYLLRGTKNLWVPFVVSFPKDALMFFIWFCGFFVSKITWRGKGFILDLGTLLVAQELNELKEPRILSVSDNKKPQQLKPRKLHSSTSQEAAFSTPKPKEV